MGKTKHSKAAGRADRRQSPNPPARPPPDGAHQPGRGGTGTVPEDAFAELGHLGASVERSQIGRTKPVHPYQWLWEPLEDDPTFVLRPMFSGRAVYIDGRLALYFTHRQEPWRGVMVCTDRERQPSLLAEFPDLAPHPILPKWLYLPESANGFEPAAERLVALVRRRDPRIGIDSPRKKQRRSSR